MLRIGFCDDESSFLRRIVNLVQDCLEDSLPQEEDFEMESVGSGSELFKLLAEKHLDVICLDIDLPNMSGFDVAKRIGQDYPHIKIIFVSAHDQFVYSSFEYYPFAFVRKKYLENEVPQVLDRYLKKLHEAQRQITITTKEGIKRVDMNAITYVESCRNYYNIHLIYGNKYVCRGTLGSFEKEVINYDFYRIHSAYIINLAYVEKLADNGHVLVKGDLLPVAQRKYSKFKKAYMVYVREGTNT